MDDQTTHAVNAVVAREVLEGWAPRSTASVAIPACVSGEERTEKDIVVVRICGGTFTMGSAQNDSRADVDERPSHQVTLNEFWIGKTELTNVQYRNFRPSHPGEADLPATRIDWAEAKATCEHFGGRLPTEAEWEYAARAGSETAWSFGDDESKLGEYAWFRDNSGGQTHPVRQKRPNAWGLYDMHGNVGEWTADWFGPYKDEAQINPSGPATGEYCALRGSSFRDVSRYLRSAVRVRVLRGVRGGDVGFRCVLDVRRWLPGRP